MCAYSNRLLLKCELLIVACSFNWVAHADQLYTLGSNKSSSSDDIILRTVYFDYKSHLRSYFWPYQEQTSDSWDWGVYLQRATGEAAAIPYSSKLATISLGWHHSSNSYLIGTVGNHRLLPDDAQEEESKNNYELEAHVGAVETGHFYYHIADDYVYQFSLQPAGIKEYLSARRQTLGVRWNPARIVRLEESMSQWNLNDDNLRRSAKFDAYMRLSSEWVWLGLSYEKMGYHDKKADYWSPQTFRSFALVFESSIPLGEKISASLAGSVSSIKEDNFPQGRGSALSLGLDLKPAKAFTIRFSSSQLKSQQESSQWSERSYRVSINGLF